MDIEVILLCGIEFQTILHENHALIKTLKPRGMTVKEFKSTILSLFQSSKSHGPRWPGTSEDGVDYLRIQADFVRCKELERLPPKASHILEYSILEHSCG